VLAELFSQYEAGYLLVAGLNQYRIGAQRKGYRYSGGANN